MNKLVRCNFCNQVIKMEEFILKDKEIGQLCNLCYTWLNQEFVPLIRGNCLCQ